MAPPKKSGSRSTLRQTVKRQDQKIKELEARQRTQEQESKIRDLRQQIQIDTLLFLDELEDRVVEWKNGLWKVHAAFEKAHENYKKTLDLREKELQAQQDIVFGAFSFATGLGIGWLGFYAKQAGKRAGRITTEVHEHFVGNLEETFKGIGGWGIDKGKGLMDNGSIDVSSSPLALLRNILEYVDKTVGKIRKEFKSLSDELRKSTPSSSGKLEDAVRERLEKHKWNYGKAEAEARAELRKKIDGVTAEYLKKDPSPPREVEMERRFERALWAFWFTTNFAGKIKEIAPWPFPKKRVVMGGPDVSRVVEDRLIALSIVKPYKKKNVQLVGGNDQEVYDREKRYVQEKGGTWDGHKAKIGNPQWTAPEGTQLVAIIDWAVSYLASFSERINFLPIAKTAMEIRQLRSNHAHAQRRALRARQDVVRLRRVLRGSGKALA